jgi:hypothetical protein
MAMGFGVYMVGSKLYNVQYTMTNGSSVSVSHQIYILELVA